MSAPADAPARVPHAPGGAAALLAGNDWNCEVIETPVGPVKVCWRGDRRDVATNLLRSARRMLREVNSRSITR